MNATRRAARGLAKLSLAMAMVLTAALGCGGQHTLGRVDAGGESGDAEAGDTQFTSGADTGTGGADTGEAECKDDLYEPNPDSSQAVDPGFVPGSGVDIDATICFGDRDWYAFEIAETTTLAAGILVYTDLVELEVEVINPELQEVVCRWNGVDPMVCGMDPGRFLLRVDYASGKGGAPTNYNIKLTI